MKLPGEKLARHDNNTNNKNNNNKIGFIIAKTEWDEQEVRWDENWKEKGKVGHGGTKDSERPGQATVR